jgi:uncharacterized protein YprB with RNaseH-like and TPR domain
MVNNGDFWNGTELTLLGRAYRSGASYRQLMALFPNRTYQAIVNQVNRSNLIRKHEALVKDKRLGHFDIETSQLNASFGFMISWALKDDGKTILSDSLTKKDFKDAGYDDPDKRIVRSMVDTLNEFDVITFHFGEYFDAPFARSRAILYGYPFPEHGQLAKIDTWKWAKRNLKLHSNRLDAIAEYLGVNSKTHLSPAIWRRASRGDLEAIAYILKHNKMDVVTLEKVYHKLKQFSSGARSSI